MKRVWTLVFLAFAFAAGYLFFFSLPAFSEQESITLTTYYPAPYGVYNQMLVQRLGVGDTDRSGSLDDGDAPGNDGDAWIAGSLGIRTTDPEFRLTLDKGVSFPDYPDGGILAIGTLGEGADLSTSGAGTRLIWYPKKAAFRAGRVSGVPSNQWDDVNIGNYSIALGYRTKASGIVSIAIGDQTEATQSYSTAMGSHTKAKAVGSTAMGNSTTASGTYSTAMGDNTYAGGDTSTAMGFGSNAYANYSTAIGFQTTAGLSALQPTIGEFSIAMGYQAKASGRGSIAMGTATAASGDTSTTIGNATTASGAYSTAMGHTTTAQAYASVVLGRYNVISGAQNSWVETDPLFVIGNGTSDIARSNALTVLKNGMMGIRTHTPGASLSIYNPSDPLSVTPGVSIINDNNTTFGLIISGNSQYGIKLGGNVDQCYDGDGPNPCSLNDYAEMMEFSELPTDGELIVIDTENPGLLKVSTQAYDTRVAGVASEEPAMVIGSYGISIKGWDRDKTTQDGYYVYPLAISGRKIIQVTDENGKVMSGDLLVSSSQRGKAMKAELLDIQESDDFQTSKQKIMHNERCRNAAFAKALTNAGENSTVLALINR